MAGRDPSLPLHQQLEAAAAEVLCCTYTRDWKQLQQLLPHALHLAAASLDPRSAAAVRECGARLLMELHIHPDLQLQQQEEEQQQRQEQHPWTGIHAHLMAAFRHHQEVGDTRYAPSNPSAQTANPKPTLQETLKPWRAFLGYLCFFAEPGRGLGFRISLLRACRAAAAALRRAVLAAPLAASSVDPFSTREGKALQVGCCCCCCCS